ncbi:MAG TPA: hypothetical protein VHM88_09585 [Candidatus Acidoferrales bacterium]|nr:hypothetical protein [Candidatus Acidoferrales bacterium]
MGRVLPHWRVVFAGLLIVSTLSFAIPGRGCPHEGSDSRLFGWTGCWVQRELTIESAQPPGTIWSFNVGHVSVKIDPRHPHLLIEWPGSAGKMWRFRMGYRWDVNARAYIFPALAIKKVAGPMREYQLSAGAVGQAQRKTRARSDGGPGRG